MLQKCTVGNQVVNKACIKFGPTDGVLFTVCVCVYVIHSDRPEASASITGQFLT